jgi:aryl-alcohol dehydrogenase-like predicted oxidoreductase
VSEWTAEQIAEALRLADEMGFDRIISNQPQYSLLWRVIEAEVVPLSEAEGIGQIVWSPLSQGVLTGKYMPGGATPPEGSRALGIEGGEMSWLLRDEVLKPVQAYAEVCRQAGYTPAAVALAWVLRNQNVSSAIIGASRPEQIAENVKALDIHLEADFVTEIEKILEPTTLFDPGFTISPAERP